MGRIRPTRSQHGVDGYVTVTSEEIMVEVCFASERVLGTQEQTAPRRFYLLTYRDEEARDVAKALRLLLGSVSSPVGLPRVLAALDFIEEKEST